MKDIVLETTVKIFFPFILVYGLYVTLYGHLGPGGGFAGGVVIGGGVIFYALTFGISKGYALLPESFATILESLGGLWYIVIGLIGLITSGFFLANALSGIPLGIPGAVISAGFIPLLNTAIGIKVAATVVSFYYMFFEEYEEYEHGSV